MQVGIYAIFAESEDIGAYCKLTAVTQAAPSSSEPYMHARRTTAATTGCYLQDEAARQYLT